MQKFRNTVVTVDGSDKYLFSGTAAVAAVIALSKADHQENNRLLKLFEAEAVDLMNLFLKANLIFDFLHPEIEDFKNDDGSLYCFPFDDGSAFIPETNQKTSTTTVEVKTTVVTSLHTVFNANSNTLYLQKEQSGILRAAADASRSSKKTLQELQQKIHNATDIEATRIDVNVSAEPNEQIFDAVPNHVVPRNVVISNC